jgi:hypothetical protein
MKTITQMAKDVKCKKVHLKLKDIACQVKKNMLR